MADLYLERIGLARPTIVKRDNDGEIERLESVGLDIASLVAFWRRCFDLNGLFSRKSFSIANRKILMRWEDERWRRAIA